MTRNGTRKTTASSKENQYSKIPVQSTLLMPSSRLLEIPDSSSSTATWLIGSMILPEATMDFAMASEPHEAHYTMKNYAEALAQPDAPAAAWREQGMLLRERGERVGAIDALRHYNVSAVAALALLILVVLFTEIYAPATGIELWRRRPEGLAA